MRGIRVIAILFCMGICFANNDISPKMTEVAQGLIEYVNNNKE